MVLQVECGNLANNPAVCSGPPEWRIEASQRDDLVRSLQHERMQRKVEAAPQDRGPWQGRCGCNTHWGLDHGAQAERIREHGGGWIARDAEHLADILRRWREGELLAPVVPTPPLASVAAGAYVGLYVGLGLVDWFVIPPSSPAQSRVALASEELERADPVQLERWTQ